jgi:hypothetical protein
VGSCEIYFTIFHWVSCATICSDGDLLHNRCTNYEVILGKDQIKVWDVLGFYLHSYVLHPVLYVTTT